MELKPCPFCGAERKLNGDLVRYQGSDEFMHWRNGCILGGFLIKDIEAWNRRAGEGEGK